MSGASQDLPPALRAQLISKLIETLPLLPASIQSLSWYSLLDEIEALPDVVRDEPAAALVAYMPTIDAAAPIPAETRARAENLMAPQAKPSGIGSLAFLSAAFAQQPGPNAF